MPIIIPNDEGKRLLEIAQAQETLTNNYLTNTSNPQTKFILEQFFKNDTARLAVLNVALGIPRRVCSIFSSYVRTPKSTLPISDLTRHIFDFVSSGYTVFRLALIDGAFSISHEPAHGYIKYDDGREVILTYLMEYDEYQNAQYYILQQTYSPGKIENKLFKTSSLLVNATNNKIEGTEVDLNSMPATKNYVAEESVDLKVNPIVVVNNVFITSDKYGESELDMVESMVRECEIQIVNIHDQLLKHLQAKLALPASRLRVEEDGSVNVRDLEAILMESGDAVPTYVMNQNPLIDKAITKIEFMLTQIASTLSIPTEFFGLQTTGGVESSEAKSIRVSAFLNKIETIRDRFSQGYAKMHEIGIAWKVIKSSEMLDMAWKAVFPQDNVSLLTELELALTNRLISRTKAVMRYQNLSEEDALKEIEAIDKETATVDVAKTFGA